MTKDYKTKELKTNNEGQTEIRPNSTIYHMKQNDSVFNKRCSECNSRIKPKPTVQRHFEWFFVIDLFYRLCNDCGHFKLKLRSLA